MGRWWTGYTSISAGRLGIAHSHGEPWLFAATERLQPAYGYGLWKAKIPSEKMCSIAVCGGAGCESHPIVISYLIARRCLSSMALLDLALVWLHALSVRGGTARE